MWRQRIAKIPACAGLGLLAIGVIVELHAWRWSWVQAVGQVLGDHVILVALSLLALGLLVLSVVRPHRRARPTAQAQLAEVTLWPWLLSDRGLLSVAGALVGVGLLALAVMWAVAGGAGPGADRAKLQVEAIKYGLGSVAAGGAAAALLLAVRRQRHAEQVHEHTIADAAERRVTEMYTKAAEQLGHSDAAVRLAGLYALQRVAQNNPGQRQTTVSVLCAYLRMPYTTPQQDSVTRSTHMPVTELPLPGREPSTDRNPRQELQVRLTAQRILATHLSRPTGVNPKNAETATPSPSQPFWPDLDIDLTGAQLIDWKLQRGHLRNATFSNATFSGSTSFATTTFTGRAVFTGATFTGPTSFNGATFTLPARLEDTTFAAGTSFVTTKFAAVAFHRAKFVGDAHFGGADFRAIARFDVATFLGGAQFVGARFTSAARFVSVRFDGDAMFDSVRFRGAQFDGATFHGDAVFDLANFEGKAQFDGATFHGDARFANARLNDSMLLKEAVVTLRDNRHDEWPPGWQLVPTLSGGRLKWKGVLNRPADLSDGSPPRGATDPPVGN